MYFSYMFTGTRYAGVQGNPGNYGNALVINCALTIVGAKAYKFCAFSFREAF